MTYKIGYLELKNAIESCKENIEAAEIAVQMYTLQLKAYEEEIKHHPRPKTDEGLDDVMPALKKPSETSKSSETSDTEE